MTEQLHNLADPMQQCGYCLGWQREELWRRIELIGEIGGDVTLRCRECGYAGLDLGRLGWASEYVGAGVRVESVAELLAVGERHVVDMHP